MATPPPKREEQLRAAESARLHEQQKRAAAGRYTAAITGEALALMLRDPYRVDDLPYVEHGLYDREEPESAIPRMLAELHGSMETFYERARCVEAIQDEYFGGPESEHAPCPPECWDKMRLQKAGTHTAAVQLIARTIELAFALDGYASAKYLWREVTRGSRSESELEAANRNESATLAETRKATHTDESPNRG